jgi:hypothetical protein
MKIARIYYIKRTIRLGRGIRFAEVDIRGTEIYCPDLRIRCRGNTIRI